MMKKLVLLTLVPMTLSLQGAFVMKKGQPLEKIEGTVENITTVQKPTTTQASTQTTSNPTTQNVETVLPQTNTDTAIPIWIIGDSTVSNYPDNETIKGKGWGQEISSIMKNPMRVHNRAMPGRSSKSYFPLREHHHNRFWGDGKTHTNSGKIGLKEDISKANTSKGGYLLIQFGHNDEYGKNYDARVDTIPKIGKEFDKHLMMYIAYAKAKNVIPVLITPVGRMAHKAKNQHGDWATTIRGVAKRENLILLDLTNASQYIYDNDFASKQEIIESYSWDGKDGTHFNKQGANRMAQAIKDLACKKSGDVALCSQFK
jgi:DNA sulfur modification protein DndE